MSDEIKKCPKCGNECAIGDLYCLKCRYKFGSDNDAEKPDRMKRVDNYTKENVKDDRQTDNEDDSIKSDSLNDSNIECNSNNKNDDQTIIDNETVKFLEQKNLDMYYLLEISPDVAENGSKRVEIFKFTEPCKSCKGFGKIYSTTNLSCPECNGKGYTTSTTNTILGTFTSIIYCPKCQENGNLIEKLCTNCVDGIVQYNKQISFDIPAGIKNGSVLKLPNEGISDLDNNVGDVYIKIKVIGSGDSPIKNAFKSLFGL